MSTIKDLVEADVREFLGDYETIEKAYEDKDVLVEEIVDTISERISELLR